MNILNSPASGRTLRLLSTVLLLAMIVATWPSFALDVDAKGVGLLDLQGPTQVEVGEPITFTLTGRGVAALGGYEAAVLFDTNVAQFDAIEQRNNDLTRSAGRDIEPLVAVEVPYGAAVGLVSCPVSDCVSRRGPRDDQGGRGTVHLASITLAAFQEGILEVKFDAIKIVTANGVTLPISIPAKTFNIQVGPSGAGPRFPAPASPWTLPTSTGGVLRSSDVTGSSLVSYSDLMEIALDWQSLREHGNPCDLPDPDHDINGDGCIDIADMQLVASRYSPAEATPAQADSELQTATDDTSVVQQAGTPTYVVNSTGDGGDAARGNGVCATAQGDCSLRAAIQEANNDAGPSRIEFNIPGSGIKTISLTKEMSSLADERGGTTIDGYTQPGASPNSDSLASNATIMIQVEGGGEEAYRGLAITTPNNVIRGMAWFHFERAFWVSGRNANSNRFVGNFIGTNAGGTYGAGGVPTTQAHGIQIQQGASNNRVGDTNPADRNVISGNGRTGVSLWHGGTTGNVLYNNLFGLRPNGTQCLPNRIHGADLNFGASDNRIGGTGAGQRNVSTGNGFSGVDVSHGTNTTGNQIIGNYLGTNLTGTGTVSNCANNQWGLRIKDGVNQNVMSNNVIGNSRVAGIEIQSPPTELNTNVTMNNLISNNRIGISLSGAPVPNPVGILINGVHNTIGPGNIIANNQNDGVDLRLDLSHSNIITKNSIFNNGGLGIDLAPNGVTQNDPNDADSGPNKNLNFPVFTSATATQAAGTACGGCTVEVFIADGGANQFGEGETFAGSGVAAANGSFVVPLTGVVPGHILTATAIDSSGNTSEFSHNFAVSGTTTAPAAPSNLTATAVSNNRINLTWSDNSTNETGFSIERSFNKSNWTVIASPSTDATTFSDNTVRVNSTYFYRIKATNPGGTSPPSNVASDTTASNMPGRIQAEDYREGGEGFAYHDTTSGNQGGAYRNDGVDIQTTQDSTGTFNVGWTEPGEWLTYDVKFATGGTYTFDLRVASRLSGKRLRVEVDNVDVTGEITVPNTGGTQNWTKVSSGPVSISSGSHTLKVFAITNGFNLNYFDVTDASTSSSESPSPPAAPGTLTANADSASQVDLAWADNADNEDNVLIERSEDQNNWSEVETVAANTETYSDQTVAASTTYYYRVSATNAAGASAPSNIASATTMAGTGTALPGRIEAEDYRGGGEGTGFHDTSIGNQGGEYRTDDVDIQSAQDATGTYNVGWVDAGEWLAYNVSFAAGGEYSFTLRLASPNTARSLHIEIDDADISGAVPVPMTGSYQSWQSVTVGPFQVDAGNHKLEIVMDTNGFNINYLEVAVPVSDPWDVTVALPGHIEAENYREGGSGTGFQDTTSTNLGSAYRQDAVDIQATQDATGTYNVGWVDAGEWLAYDVSFDTSGTVTFMMRVASEQTGKSFHIELDDVDVTGTISVPNTGSWQEWADVSSPPVPVTAGNYILKIVAETNGFNMNYLDVAAAP